MPKPLLKPRSRRGPIALFVAVLALGLALLVLWNVVLAIDYGRIRELARLAAEREGAAFHWVFIAVGSALLLAIISLVSILGAWLFQEIRYTRRLSSFIATFSHELNSPLASVKLFVQTLRTRELDPAERRRFLDLILCDLDRLHGQISNVLRTAQLEAHRGIVVRPEPRALGAYLDSYVRARAARVEWSERNASLTLRRELEVTAAVDEAALRQVLDNLVDNALRYGGSGGVRVEIALLEGRDGDAVAIEVRDDGPGIAAEDLEQVFERFGQGSAAPGTPRSGTGLGLFIVRSLVEAHGGKVFARSPGRDQGTTIRIELPGLPAAPSVPVGAAAGGVEAGGRSGKP